MKRHIPNILTLLNLFAGMVACLLAIKGHLIASSLCICLGIFFDFFDGFAARLLDVKGALGKQLDSLADAITSGVAPSFIMYQLLSKDTSLSRHITYHHETWNLLAFLGFLLGIAAVYRLANFNIDERQNNSFIGLPTPAMALVVISLPLMQHYSNYHTIVRFTENPLFLIGIIFLLCYLMNAEIALFSLKFKDFSWKKNWFRYLFIGVSIILLLLLPTVAIPCIILLYVVSSVIINTLD